MIIKFKYFKSTDEIDGILEFSNSKTKEVMTVGFHDTKKFEYKITIRELKNLGIIGHSKTGKKIINVNLGVTRLRAPHEQKKQDLKRRKIDS